MSILLADSSATTMPATIVQAASADTPTAVLWIFISWAVIGLIVAAMLGAFRRKSIVGPQRLLPTQSAWHWLVVLYIAWFAGFVAYKALFYFIHPSPVMGTLLQAAPDLVIFATGILMLMRLEGGAIQSIGLSPQRITSGIVGGAATVFVLYPLILLTSAGVEQIYSHLHIKIEAHEILQFLSNSKNRRLNIIAISLAVLIAPLNEELIFRGLFQTILVRFFGWLQINATAMLAGPQLSATAMESQPGRRFPLTAWADTLPVPAPGAGVRWAAVIGSACVFAGVHDPAFRVPIFVLAIGLGYVYERTGNLWVTITAHALFNSAQILYFLTQLH